MELLYNPDRMSESEIKKTFVARQPLVDELVSLVEHQPNGAGVQHVVIIAPRGMGKTTVLLMVKFTIKDRGLADRWQAVKFPEESYGVYDLADFWLKVLDLLAAETGDAAPRQQAENLKRKYPSNDELQEAAFAAIKDWRRNHSRRLVLLVENLDMLLAQINDERDNARLRDVMMNDDTVMILGGATTFFKEARAYDQPLYNFFKLYDLADLKFSQVQELLRHRAELDRLPNFEATLQANISRLRALEYFTGGNPRLALMLYRIVAQSELGEVRRALEKLLDEVTPYYKSKIENLPPQQRKILDHIAHISGQTNNGLTPGEIAIAVRLAPNQVSSQLKRLSEVGYVHAANTRGRSSFYTLSEPLYAIWHQMRFGHDAHERMRWLVNFMRVWYAADEFAQEIKRLETRFREYVNSERKQEAHDVLEHLHYFVQAMERKSESVDVLNWIICQYLDFEETEKIKSELLLNINLIELPNNTLNRLYESDCISLAQLSRAKLLKGDKPERPIPESEAREVRVKLPLSQGVFHVWDLSQEDFDRLLSWLHPAREGAAQKYEAIRRRVYKTLDARGCNAAMEIFDETVYRIARKLPELIVDYEGDPALYFYGVANLVYLEYLRAQVETEEITPSIPAPTTKDVEPQYECMEKCLNELPPADKELMLRFYRGAKTDKRKDLADQFGLTDNALRLRVFRVRQKLAACIERCLSSERQDQRSSPDNSEDIRTQQEFIAFMEIAQSGDLSFVRQQITEANMEKQLSPLTIALDYLIAGNQTLIEKLSPEVKGIVEEIIAKLRSATKNAQPKKKK